MTTAQHLPEAVRTSRPYQVLERSMANNRLAHGILLYGENLEILEQVSLNIASQLLKTGSALNHPDCFTCRPRGKARMLTIGTKAEKKDGKWPEGTIRRLVTDLSMTSNQGGRKVGILYDAERMNDAAANAFLKTLEEPPAGTTLFLLTTRPYDLLDTIRSRCLNFRVPSVAAGIQHPDWHGWASDYRSWLSRLLQGPNRKSIPHIMLGAYGLNTRFQAILEEMTKASWAQQKESLPEHVTADEKEAMEAGLSKGYRKQLFGEIEKITAGFVREIEQLNPGRLPVNALHRATETLEHVTGLLELNFNQAAALELFFLKSLRIWTTVK